MNSLNKSAYFFFMFAGIDLASLIFLGWSSVPMLYSSISDYACSIVGFFATSLKSNSSSKGARPPGIFLSLVCSTSTSSVSAFSHFSVGFPVCSEKNLFLCYRVFLVHQGDP